MSKVVLLLALTLAFGSNVDAGPTNIYVSPEGNDRNTGAIDKPVATLLQAQTLARSAVQAHAAVAVFLREGTYRLAAPLVFTTRDSGSREAPISYQSYLKESVIISGGSELPALDWQPYKDGIMQAKVAIDLSFDQLFVNGELQRMARYPNYDSNVPIYNGHAADAINPERVAR